MAKARSENGQGGGAPPNLRPPDLRVSERGAQVSLGPDPTVQWREPLVMGHFREVVGYRVDRPRGLEQDWLLIYTVAGRGWFSHGEGELIVRPHEAVLLRPGYVHSYATAEGTRQSPGEWELLWAHFRPTGQWMDWLNWPEVGPGMARLGIDDAAAQKQVVDRLKACLHILNGFQPRREALAHNALEAALLWCDTCNPHVDELRLDPRVRAALDLIRRQMREPLTLADLAEAVSLSPSRLRHLFTEQLGVSPTQALEQERMSRARQLLELSGHSVGVIAEEVGYPDPFYFATRFKKTTGLSPRAYRKRRLGR